MPRSREAGFTLVELMVVVLIIAILLAIAIPTYLGLRGRASDRAVQADLRTGLEAALVHFNDSESFSGFNATTAETVESSLRWVGPGGPSGDATPPAVGEVKVQISNGNRVLLVARSATQTFFCMGQRNPGPQILRGRHTTFANVDTTTDCVQGW